MAFGFEKAVMLSSEWLNIKNKTIQTTQVTKAEKLFVSPVTAKSEPVKPILLGEFNSSRIYQMFIVITVGVMTAMVFGLRMVVKQDS